VAGGSWTAASSGTAVMKACRDIAEQAFKLARGMENSPLANADFGVGLVFLRKILVRGGLAGRLQL
jgi:CO/xanthine dehydrogenase Mo-binding subunit